MSEVMHLHLQ